MLNAQLFGFISQLYASLNKIAEEHQALHNSNDTMTSSTVRENLIQSSAESVASISLGRFISESRYSQHYAQDYNKYVLFLYDKFGILTLVTDDVPDSTKAKVMLLCHEFPNKNIHSKTIKEDLDRVFVAMPKELVESIRSKYEVSSSLACNDNEHDSGAEDDEQVSSGLTTPTRELSFSESAETEGRQHHEGALRFFLRRRIPQITTAQWELLQRKHDASLATHNMTNDDDDDADLNVTASAVSSAAAMTTTTTLPVNSASTSGSFMRIPHKPLVSRSNNGSSNDLASNSVRDAAVSQKNRNQL